MARMILIDNYTARPLDVEPTIEAVRALIGEHIDHLSFRIIHGEPHVVAAWMMHENRPYGWERSNYLAMWLAERLHAYHFAGDLDRLEMFRGPVVLAAMGDEPTQVFASSLPANVEAGLLEMIKALGGEVIKDE